MLIGSQQRGKLVIVESKGCTMGVPFWDVPSPGISSRWGFALACPKAEDVQFEACNYQKLGRSL